MVDQSRRKVCVILGAGASNDVRNAGAAVLNEGLRPPLARDLFNLDQHADFRPILAEYEGAVVLAQHLAPRSGHPGFDLEKELRRLAEHPEDQIREHYKGIPPYLRDLLMMCSYNYASYPSCYIQLVQALLGEVPSDVLFLVLNYDDLLEQALYRFSNGTIRFESIEDYVRPDQCVRVIKLHGSINWFKPIGPAHNDWKALLRTTNVLSKHLDNQVHVVGRKGEHVQSRTYQIEIDGQRVYPILTAPLAGKGTAEVVCPVSHFAKAHEFLRDCSRFLIIGSSGLDTDLLDLLKVSVRVNFPQIQFVCGSESRGQEVRERFESHIPIFKRLTSPEGRAPAFDGGFESYVASDALVNFLKEEGFN